MYNLLLIVGSILIVIALIVMRTRFLPVLYLDTELFINLLNRYCSEKMTILDDDLSSNMKGKNKT